MDAAFLVGADPTHVGWPVRVHRAHLPSTVLQGIGWHQVGDVPMQDGSGNAIPNDLLRQVSNKNKIFVALQDRAPEPLLPDAHPDPDIRLRTRLVCFPSGERPRAVASLSIGGGVNAKQSGTIPSAVVDEIVFGDAQFPAGTDVVRGASLILTKDVGESELSFTVDASGVRLADGGYSVGANKALSLPLPEDAGLLRIGDEIVAYDSRDASSGLISLATNGRGLLGTHPQPHEKTEPVLFLEHHTVSFLSDALGAGDATLHVANIEEFPDEGTVLVGTELIHYTRLRDGALEMPRNSSVAGKKDAKGTGLFRGRYGSVDAAHAAGEAVILFPFRYWDRWCEKADAPEISYFGLTLDQPAAFCSSCFFMKTDTTAAQVGVLQRTDPNAPWDADPETDKRLKVYWKGDVEGLPIQIGAQSDRVEWRVFVKYAPNAFDAKTGMSSGWRETPRLTRFGAFYSGPSMVLRSVER